MIRLTLVGDPGRAATGVMAAYFRISGGAVWTRPGERLIWYVGPSWQYQKMLWAGMRFEGKFRVVFGLPRDPMWVSGRLRSLSIHGRTLEVNGAPFAVYEPRRDLWRGAVEDTWWHAFRVESLELRQPPGGPGERTNVTRSPNGPRRRGR